MTTKVYVHGTTRTYSDRPTAAWVSVALAARPSWPHVQTTDDLGRVTHIRPPASIATDAQGRWSVELVHAEGVQYLITCDGVTRLLDLGAVDTSGDDPLYPEGAQVEWAALPSDFVTPPPPLVALDALVGEAVADYLTAAGLGDAVEPVVAAWLSEYEMAGAVASYLDAHPGAAQVTSRTDVRPLYVDTVAGVVGSIVPPTGVRAGLAATTYPDGQGFLAEHHVGGVSGTRGTTTLTVTDTATLATLVGGGTGPWDGVVQDSTDAAVFVTVTGVSGGTVTLLRPLPIDVSGGVLASRIDAAAGQHLTLLGYRALAQLIARTSPVIGCRGGILDGQWDTLPPSYRTLWAKNAAMTAYGEINSSDGGANVRTYITAQDTANEFDPGNWARRINRNPGGVKVGTHAAGHGVTATFRPGRRPSVLELWTTSSRDASSLPTVNRVRVVVGLDDGTTIYDRVVDGALYCHRIPAPAGDALTVEVTNHDGAIAYINISQVTLREAGVGTRIGGRKIVVLGDSWTQYSGQELGAELARVTGSTVVTHGLGGTTTEWGLAWWDEYVRKERPDDVVIHFYTNDLNNNQDSTMPIPGGATVSMWPNGLSQAQAEARWIANIAKMIALAQADGIRPVIVMPGGVNVVRQFAGAIHLERPRLIDWSATTAELADPAAYVNMTGKTAGATVKVGSSTRYAAGPLPGDPWKDPTSAAIEGLQRLTLHRDAYNLLAGTVLIGTDSNGDGLSDGLTYQDAGVLTGDTYTPSIVAGAQRLTCVYAASGSGGSRRLRANFTAAAGKEYLLVADIANATDVGSTYTDTFGGANLWSNLGGSLALTSGAGLIYVRGTAATSGAKYASIATTPVAGTTKAFDVKRWAVIDVAALVADAPNAANMSTADLAAFVMGMNP